MGVDRQQSDRLARQTGTTGDGDTNEVSRTRGDAPEGGGGGANEGPSDGGFVIEQIILVTIRKTRGQIFAREPKTECGSRQRRSVGHYQGGQVVRIHDPCCHITLAHEVKPGDRVRQDGRERRRECGRVGSDYPCRVRGRVDEGIGVREESRPDFLCLRRESRQVISPRIGRWLDGVTDAQRAGILNRERKSQGLAGRQILIEVSRNIGSG